MSQGLIQTGFGFENGMKNLMNSKPVSVCQMEYALRDIFSQHKEMVICSVNNIISRFDAPCRHLQCASVKENLLWVTD